MGGRFNINEFLNVKKAAEEGERQNGGSDLADRDSDEDTTVEEEESLEQWVLIQKEAFTNWCNDKLKAKGVVIHDVKYDFRDGSSLCKLMEVLRNKPLRGKVASRARLNWVTANGNITLAMNAMREDGIKMVNIGPEDVVSGNTKLILGMVWLLIRRYQIGSQTKVPPKRLMLAWINAVLHPHISVSNFSTDWNDGRALQGVIEYCRPGTCPEWWQLNTNNRVANCGTGLDLAFQHFGIPRIVSPEHLASVEMDELSGMTYMSYFMSVGACGYQATLDWVQKSISPVPVSNFDTDWNSGLIASALVTVLGANVGWPNIDTTENISACRRAIYVSVNEFGLPVGKFLSEKEMVNPEVDHIEIMAYAAWHRNGPNTRVKIQRPSGVNFPTPTPVVVPKHVPPVTPAPRVEERLSAIQEEQDALDAGRAVRFAPLPPPPPTPPLLEDDPEPDVDLELIMGDVLPLWHVVSAEIHVHKRSSDTISRAEHVTGEFTLPSGETQEAEIFMLADGKYNLTFQPDEPGTWFLELLHRGERTRDLPWRILVVDPAAARIQRDMFEPHAVDQKYIFKVDLSELNHDSIDVRVESMGELVPYQVTQKMTNIDSQLVSFTPRTAAMYTISVKCLDKHITGSPFELMASVRSSDNEDDTSEPTTPTVVTPTIVVETPPSPVDVNPPSPPPSPTPSPVPTPVSHPTPSPVPSPVSHPSPSPVPSPTPARTPAPRLPAFNGISITPAITPTITAVPTASLSRRPAPGPPPLVTITKASHTPGPSSIPPLLHPAAAEPVFATGLGLREAREGVQAKFKVDVSREPGKMLEVDIRDPRSVQLPSIITKSDSWEGDVIEFSVFYTPKQPGRHRISIVYNAHEISDSPFHPMVKPGRVRVLELDPIARLGRKHRFWVDASEAGEGQVMIDSDLPVITYDKLQNRKYQVVVMPKKVGRHDIKILHNGKEIDGSPFVIEVVKGDRPASNGHLRGPRTTGRHTQLLRDGF